MSDMPKNDEDAGEPGIGQLGKLPQPVVNDAIVPAADEPDADAGGPENEREAGGGRAPAGDVNDDRVFDYGEKPVEPGP